MSGHGTSQSRFGFCFIPDFTDNNDVGIVPQNLFEGRFKR